MKEYEGIDLKDEQVVKIVTEFCYNLAIGDIDKVIKAVKLIKNENVWLNLANLCVKMRRLTLARMCLGKLKNAKALRSVSHARKYKDQNKLAAQYALHLGLYDEAKDIWAETKSFAEMNLFYQDTSQWEKALEIATTKDRVSLPVTYYRFAKSLQEAGDFNGAIAAFEKSNASK